MCEGFLWLWRAGATSHRGRGPLTVAAPLVAEHRLQTRRLSSCGSRAQLLRGMWDLPRPGLEPASPALAGRLSTTAPPGKTKQGFFKFISIVVKLFFLFQHALFYVKVHVLSSTAMLVFKTMKIYNKR